MLVCVVDVCVRACRYIHRRLMKYLLGTVNNGHTYSTHLVNATCFITLVGYLVGEILVLNSAKLFNTLRIC